MLTPDPDDPLKIRRRLAVMTALYALFLVPGGVVYFGLHGLEQPIIHDLLVYIGVIAAGPIGAYLWACKALDNQNGGN